MTQSSNFGTFQTLKTVVVFKVTEMSVKKHACDKYKSKRSQRDLKDFEFRKGLDAEIRNKAVYSIQAHTSVLLNRTQAF